MWLVYSGGLFVVLFVAHLFWLPIFAALLLALVLRPMLVKVI
jgi:hypothetical protein